MANPTDTKDNKEALIITSLMRGFLARKLVKKMLVASTVEDIVKEIESNPKLKPDLSIRENISHEKRTSVLKVKDPEKSIVKLNNQKENIIWKYIKPTKPIHIVLYVGAITFSLTKIFKIAAVKAFCTKSAIATWAALKYAAMSIATLFSKITLASALPYIVIAAWLATIILLIVVLNKYSSNDETLKVTPESKQTTDGKKSKEINNVIQNNSRKLTRKLKGNPLSRNRTLASQGKNGTSPKQ